MLFDCSTDASVSTEDIGDVNIDEANDVNDDVDTDYYYYYYYYYY